MVHALHSTALNFEKHQNLTATCHARIYRHWPSLQCELPPANTR